MDYRNIGKTDLSVSELCLGTMTFGWSADKETSFAIMDRAFEAGINFFDTADVYTNWISGNPGGVAETWIGEWLAQRKPQGLVLATKVRGRMWEGKDGAGLSRAHIMRAVEDSLRRLQVETIDLYQSHSPDEDTPQEETLRAFDDLVQQGKARAVGCSNFSVAELSEALKISADNGLARYECLQPNYSLVKRDDLNAEMLALCQRENIGIIPYSPLARGFLTGKYRAGQDAPAGSRGENDTRLKRMRNKRNFALLDKMDTIAQMHGKTLTQVALAWQLSQPGITSPIIGATTIAQLDDSLGAVGFQLSDAEMRLLG